MTYLDMWRSGTFPEKPQVYGCTTDCKHGLSARHQTVLAMFLGFRKPLYSCTEGMCHSSTPLGTSLNMISFTRCSLVLVLQATNAGVRRTGYEASLELVPLCIDLRWMTGIYSLFILVASTDSYTLTASMCDCSVLATQTQFIIFDCQNQLKQNNKINKICSGILSGKSTEKDTHFRLRK